MEKYFTQEVVIGIVAFIAGMVVLTFCARIEKAERDIRRDPKEKWKYIDGKKKNQVRKKTTVGTLMTLVGYGLTVFGMVFFFMHIKI